MDYINILFPFLCKRPALDHLFIKVIMTVYNFSFSYSGPKPLGGHYCVLAMKLRPAFVRYISSTHNH